MDFIGSPMIIGHRGASADAPENTLAAFMLAFEQGAQAIELDLQMSLDGEMVVIHDSTVERTTDRSGRVSKMTLEQLKACDAGSWFHERFGNERIPTLEEVYDLVPDDGLVNIEIKPDTNGVLEAKLVKFLRERGRLDRDFVCSWQHRNVWRLKKLAPEAKIGLPYAANFIDHSVVPRTFEFESYSLHPRHDMIDRDEIRKLTAEGWKVFPWTVDEEYKMQELIEANVSGIITNRPLVMRELLKSMGWL